jgi:large subunit ribosomal protein L4
MSKIKVYNLAGEEKGELALSENFTKKVSDLTLAKYVNYIRAAQRQAIAHTKDRGDVSGGGKKPWKQKGTGHARVGSSRSPLWVHGGVTFGPTKDRNFKLSMTKKSRSLSRQTIFNYFFDQKQVKIINKIDLKSNKTKDADLMLSKLKMEGKIALFLAKNELNFAQYFRNLSYVFLNAKDNIDILNIVGCDWLIITREAFLEIWPDKKTSKKESDEKDS